jgi:hypothetical protein
MGGANAVDVYGGDVQGLRHAPSLLLLDGYVDVVTRLGCSVLSEVCWGWATGHRSAAGIETCSVLVTDDSATG